MHQLDKKYWKEYLLLIVIVVFIIIGIVKNFKQANFLERDGIISMGRVIKFEHSRKSTYYLTFQYDVKGKVYRNEIPCNYFICALDENPGCVGKDFEIVYSASDPQISDINLGSKNEYKRMNLYY